MFGFKKKRGNGQVRFDRVKAMGGGCYLADTHTRFWSAILVVFLSALLLFAGAFSMFRKETNAADNTIAIDELTLTGDGTGKNGKVFSADALNELYDAILGNTGSAKGTGTYNDVANLIAGTYTKNGHTYTVTGANNGINPPNIGWSASGGTQSVTLPNYVDAEGIRTRAGGNITVKFGGVEWHVTYITRDKNGNVILDLLQKTETVAKSTYSGGTGYSVAYHSTDGTGGPVSGSSIYGQSLIRSQALNAGSDYYNWTSIRQTGEGSLVSGSQNSNHAYANFTMPGLSTALTNYIVKPADVLYQARISGKAAKYNKRRLRVR